MSEDARRRIPAFCPLCVSRCGCEAVVENGRLVAIEPDPSHPTGKALCAKGRASPELVEAPDRLLYPLRRTRPKGDPDPGWQRITWDEALDETAAALRRIAAESGPEAVAFAVTTSRYRDLGCAALGRPPDQRLRLAEQLQRDGDLRLASPVCPRLHHRHRHRHAGLRESRLHPVVGPQSEHLAGWPQQARSPGARSRRQADRGRSAPYRACGQGRLLAAGAARHRCGAGAGASPGVMIEQGWFDAEFVRDWTNGPFLVREDNGSLLRADALAARRRQGVRRLGRGARNGRSLRPAGALLCRAAGRTRTVRAVLGRRP